MNQEIAPGVSPPWGLPQIEEVKEVRMDHIVFPGLSDQLTLAEQIRIIRRRRGLTQAEVAEAAGVTPMTISQIEAGSVTPKAKNLEAIIKALGHEVVIYLGNSGLRAHGYSDPNLPAWLRTRREARGWNQAAVAAIAGMSMKTIHRFETGRQFPSEENILRIINALYDNQARVVLEPVGDE